MSTQLLSSLSIALVCFWQAVAMRSATTCNPSECRSRENCACISTQPPGNLNASVMPQFVMLTFDDAINEGNMAFYRQLLDPGKRRNRANGCNMAATFFVSAGYTDYSLVHELHSVGSEIAIHSITHRNNLTYWRTLDVAGWKGEFVGDRDLLRDYAAISEKDMIGARAPFLEIGNGEAYDMLLQNGFVYDSSICIDYMNKTDKLPFFPYTLDYGLGVDCTVPSCPNRGHRGLWLVPLNSYYMTTASAGDGSRTIVSSCAMPDTCSPKPTTDAETLDFLRSNFERYYHSNRAPFPVFIHETWLWTPGRRQGYLSFVDWLLTLDDVFIVSVAEVVRFMKDPKPIGEYVQVDCSKASEFKRCPEVHTCSFPDSPIKEARHLVGCRPCPQRYPWLRDVVRTVKHDVSYEVAEKQNFCAGCVILICLAIIVCLAYLSAKPLARGNKTHTL